MFNQAMLFSTLRRYDRKWLVHHYWLKRNSSVTNTYERMPYLLRIEARMDELFFL
jgi:hypothetical protein